MVTIEATPVCPSRSIGAASGCQKYVIMIIEATPTCPSRSIGAYIRSAMCSFREYALELYDRPSSSLELERRMLRTEALKAMLYGCVYDNTLRRAHHSFLPRCIVWRKTNRTDHHSISHLEKALMTGGGVRASIYYIILYYIILYYRRLCAGGGGSSSRDFFVACMEDTRLLKCVMFGE